MVGRCMKRYARIAITYFVIAVLALLLSGIIQSNMSVQREFRGAISSNAIAIEVRDYHEDSNTFCQTLADSNQCTAIYKIFPYANANAVWFRNPAQEQRPILTGTFFDENHLQSSDKFAVVGKNIYDYSVTYLDQSPIIYFDTQPYKVIGVLGYENRTSDYDDTIYINLSSLLANEKYVADGEYIIDYTAKSNNRYDEIIASVLQNQPSEATIMQVAMDKYIPSVTDVLEDNSVINLLAISLVMVLLTSFSVTLEWIDKRKKEIAVRKQLGATTGRITVYLYSRFLVVAIIMYAVAYPLYATYHSRIMEWLQYPACTIDMLEAFLVYVACIAVSLIGCVPAIATIRKILPQALVR